MCTDPSRHAAEIAAEVDEEITRDDSLAAAFARLAGLITQPQLRRVISRLAAEYLERSRRVQDWHDRLYELEDARDLLAHALRQAEAALAAHKEERTA